MSEFQKGIFALIACCTIWGFAPILYKVLSHVPPLEMLSHRILWAFLFFGIVLAVQGRLFSLRQVFSGARAVWMILIAAVMIAVNWGLFIYSIQFGHAVEASLGYFVFPLVAVAFGATIFGEKIYRPQAVAVGLATLGVVALTIGLGVAPWIALILAGTFGLYGLVKKQIAAGPVLTVTTESLLLLPFALIWLWGVHFQNWEGLTGTTGAIFGESWRDTLLLLAAGPVTAVPLVLFSYGAKRVPLSTVGVVMYLNPTLQFLVAVLVFSEAFTGIHAISFGLIWIALSLYSIDSIRRERLRS
ncbi:EamA family transporter RarD [Cochlodiniinecator piscidefendens]|uniref:EamA family transporter RarD n=1 Tax=Cochlodiniinecator piscidefendens TaxID=2715756 RepID=UPI001409F49B|nr:EamA family transporter RarD [Cochlodiniinecator piscidefendens]